MDTIKVLWVDDQDFEQIENIAASPKFEIDITHVYSWEEAIPYLKGVRFEDWSAIILDCYCCMYPNGNPDNKFLRKALNHLGILAEGRLLPWYILSQGTGDGFLSIIDNQLTEERELWDNNWEKVYYSKTSGDYLKLLENIKSMAPQLPNYKVRHRFKEVFSMIGIEELFSSQLPDIMFPVLKALYYPESINSLSLVGYYNQLRKAVECLFRSCHKMGLLPDEFIDPKTGVNLSLSSHYLAGNHAIWQEGYYKFGEKDEHVFPEAIAKVVKDILYIANTESHTVDLSDDEKKQIEEYLSDPNSGQYVIYSMAMGLCSVFVWYKQYLLEHLDPQKNKEKCKFISNKNNSLANSNYEGQEMIVEVDENNNVHCGECQLHDSAARFNGCVVNIFNVKNNTRKNGYPYYAQYKPIK